MSDSGYVYFLSNLAMPGLLKIGFTKASIDARIGQLTTSGVPSPFVLEAAFRVLEPEECEKQIHEALKDKRVRRDREFFKISVAEAVTSAIPLLSSRLDGKEAASAKDKDSSAEIEKADDFALKMLAHDFGEGGSIEDMINGGHWEHPLNLRHRMIKLAERGLVEEVKRGSRRQCWRLTNAGLKFMFENDLLLTDLMEDELKFR